MPGRYTSISPRALSELLKTEPDVFLLDVRESFELIAFGAIPSVRNIPIGEITGRLSELPADTAHPIAVVCQSGSRSADVAAFLSGKGFVRVYNLEGGTYGWLMSGLPAARHA